MTNPEAAADGAENSAPHEEIAVEGKTLAAKVKDLIHEGNVRRIVVRNAEGATVLEIPVTAGVIGAVALPAVAAVGAIAGLANNWTVDVYRRSPEDVDGPDATA